MAFSSPEFPGLSFGSIDELKALRRARDEAKRKLHQPVVVKANKDT